MLFYLCFPNLYLCIFFTDQIHYSATVAFPFLNFIFTKFSLNVYHPLEPKILIHKNDFKSSFGFAESCHKNLTADACRTLAVKTASVL